MRQDELAEQLQLSGSAVEKALRALRRSGHVHAEAVHGPNGYRNKSRLTLPTMPEEARWTPGE
jgi:biotin operon repressor